MSKKFESQSTLWCLPYDSDSVFKTFLKVPFAVYLNNIISNQYFAKYQQAISKQSNQRASWNEKCWKLIKFYEFLNDKFEVDKWDNYITFIEDTTLRNTLGFFRLWIDTERLYLFNFLKLDSNQFQEDRIYLSLYRILIFFNNLFTQYIYKDFDSGFLNEFIKQCSTLLQSLAMISTNEANDLIQYTIALLHNVKKKQRHLVDPKVLHTLKKSATVKVSKEADSIKQVQNRLLNSAGHKKKIDEQIRLKMISKSEVIDEFTASVRTVYNPIEKIKQQEEAIDFFGSAEEKIKKKQAIINEKIQKYKKSVLDPDFKQSKTLFQSLQKDERNPYTMQNYQIYGESVKVNMEKKKLYEKQKQAEVVSVEDYDRTKIFYDEKFLQSLQAANRDSSIITEKDINNGKSKRSKNFQSFKNQQNENMRVFNLKWHQDPTTTKRTQDDDSTLIKNYDNNLLFKSPLQEQLLQTRRNGLEKIRDNMGVKSYTVALCEQLADMIHPQHLTYSFGLDNFVKKTPQTLDIKNFKLINQNKFDFMRKVVAYMTAQKKIKNLIQQKSIPQLYPRYFPQVKQNSYNPMLQTDKVKFARGQLENRPSLYL